MSTPASAPSPATSSRSTTVMRWVVGHHRVVLALWALLTVGLLLVAPPFAEVAVRDNSAFLPADTPVVQGAKALEEGWPQDVGRVDLVVVAAREGGPLGVADRAYLESLAVDLAPGGRVDGVVSLSSAVDPDEPIADALRSPDGRAALLALDLEGDPYTPDGDATVADVRAVVAESTPPAGLEVATTGIAAIGADQNEVIAATTGRTTVLSILLVSLILLLIFRSPITPLVPLVTVGVALAVSQAVVSLLAAAGMQVSDLYESFATVVVFGAGTDYGLFMVSRYAEEVDGHADHGTPPRGLVTTAAALVVVITGSAGTTIVGFASQSVADFGLYRTMGPALAIAMAVALLAGLTLAPALIRAFGGLLWWPRRLTPRPIAGGALGLVPPPPPAADRGVMTRIAGLVATHPGRITVVVGGLMLGLAGTVLLADITRDDLAELPADAPSVVGFELAAAYLPPGALNPITIVVADPDDPVEEAEAMRALAVASTNLLRLEQVSSVRSLALPTSGEVPAEVAAEDPVAQLEALPGQVGAAADGAEALQDGVAEVADGTAQLADGLDELARRLPDASSGAAAVAQGAREARDGAQRLLDGAREARAGAQALAVGAEELSTGLGAAREGAGRLQAEVATPAEAAIAEAADALAGFSVGLADPQYRRAAESVGQTFGLLTGRFPPGHPQAGQQVDPAYPGLSAALSDLTAGLAEADAGADALAAGARELVDGLGALEEGLVALLGGLDQLAAGAGDLAAGVDGAVSGATALADGAQQLDAGVDGQLAPGAADLATGLRQGAAALDPTRLSQLGDALGGDGPFVVTSALLQDPALREQLSIFTSADGRATRLFVTPEGGPFEPASLALVDEAVEVVQRSLGASPLADAEVLPTGVTAFSIGIGQAADRDFPIIAAAVVLGLLLVMGLLLRSVVAPIYMVASVLLSYTAALGVTTLVFQGLLGADGIVWWVPSFLFVLLVALGVDYNIFLIGRAREEAETTDSRTAVRRALTATGPTITSAGIILVGTFAVLAVSPLQGLQQMGVAAATGILLDTFVVRTLLVPAVATMLGRLNWWPSARWRRA